MRTNKSKSTLQTLPIPLEKSDHHNILYFSIRQAKRLSNIFTNRQGAIRLMDRVKRTVAKHKRLNQHLSVKNPNEGYDENGDEVKRKRKLRRPSKCYTTNT